MRFYTHGTQRFNAKGSWGPHHGQPDSTTLPATFFQTQLAFSR